MRYLKWLKWKRECKKEDLVQFIGSKEEFYRNLPMFNEIDKEFKEKGY